MKYLKKFKTHIDYAAYINGSDKVLPNISYCENENEIHYNPYVPTPQLPLILTQYEWEYGEAVVTDRNGSLIEWENSFGTSNESYLVDSGGLFMWYHINWEGPTKKVTVTEIDEGTTTFNVDGVDYVLSFYELTPAPELP